MIWAWDGPPEWACLSRSKQVSAPVASRLALWLQNESKAEIVDAGDDSSVVIETVTLSRPQLVSLEVAYPRRRVGGGHGTGGPGTVVFRSAVRVRRRDRSVGETRLCL